MNKTRVVIHLSPIGTQSQNIEEYTINKDPGQLPHYVIGIKESEFTVINTNSIDTYNNSNISGVGLLGSYDREAIDIVVCLPQTKNSDIVEIDDSNQYFEQVRESLIKTISGILQKITIGVSGVISHKEAYESGMAVDVEYCFENWWNSWHGFYNMDYLRSDIQTYQKYETISDDYRRYVNGDVEKVLSKENDNINKSNDNIYRVIIPNTVLTDDLEQKIQGLGYNPSPLLFFKNEEEWYTGIQIKAYFDQQQAENLKEDLIKYGYPNVEVTTDRFNWDKDIDNCIRNQEINQNIQMLLSM